MTTKRARFIIEADFTEPPPDYLEYLDSRVRKEMKFILGPSSEVVRSEWVDEEPRALTVILTEMREEDGDR